MTELMEAVAIANIDDKTKDLKCPFCQEKPLGHVVGDAKKVSDKIKSVPKNLECKNTDSWNSGSKVKREKGDLQYTLAQHHLISAMQCYAKIRRLVRMGNLAEYDINCKENGIGLPTTHYTIKYPENGKKYGDLDNNGKQKVAFSLMKELGAQWHVGHHAFAIKAPKIDFDTWQNEGMDEKNEDDVPHETQYDQEVLSRIFNLCKSFPSNFCEDPERDEKFKKDMDKISKEIKDKLEKFKGGNKAKPAESYPFFVSRQAYDYSGCSEDLPHKEKKSNTDEFERE